MNWSGYQNRPERSIHLVKLKTMTQLQTSNRYLRLIRQETAHHRRERMSSATVATSTMEKAMSSPDPMNNYYSSGYFLIRSHKPLFG